MQQTQTLRMCSSVAASCCQPTAPAQKESSRSRFTSILMAAWCGAAAAPAASWQLLHLLADRRTLCSHCCKRTKLWTMRQGQSTCSHSSHSSRTCTWTCLVCLTTCDSSSNSSQQQQQNSHKTAAGGRVAEAQHDPQRPACSAARLSHSHSNVAALRQRQLVNAPAAVADAPAACLLLLLQLLTMVRNLLQMQPSLSQAAALAEPGAASQVQQHGHLH